MILVTGAGLGHGSGDGGCAQWDRLYICIVVGSGKRERRNKSARVSLGDGCAACEINAASGLAAGH